MFDFYTRFTTRWPAAPPTPSIAPASMAATCASTASPTWRTLRLPQLISLIRVGNLASKRVAEKVGMGQWTEIERHGLRYWQYTMENPEK